MRSGTPLVTSLLESGRPGGFHAPAPSAHGLSQPFDGLLLRAASLSCFVQAPLMGFKEQEQTHRGTWCVLGRQLRRANPPRSRHAWTTRATEVTRRACHSSAAAFGASTVSAFLRPYRHVTHQHPCGQRRWEAGPSVDQAKAYSIITMHRVSSLAGNTPRYPNRQCKNV